MYDNMYTRKCFITVFLYTQSVYRTKGGLRKKQFERNAYAVVPRYLAVYNTLYMPTCIYNITGRDGQLNNDVNRYYINMELKNRIGMRKK